MIKALLAAIKQTIEGNDGKISSRKITAFWFVILATIDVLAVAVLVFLMVLKKGVPLSSQSIDAANILIELLWVLIFTILILFGVVTFQQIMSFRTFGRIEEKKEETIQEIIKSENEQG